MAFLNVFFFLKTAVLLSLLLLSTQQKCVFTRRKILVGFLRNLVVWTDGLHPDPEGVPKTYLMSQQKYL